MYPESLLLTVLGGVMAVVLVTILLPVLGIGAILAIVFLAVVTAIVAVGASSLRRRARRRMADRLCPFGPPARPEDIAYTVTCIAGRVRAPRFGDYTAEHLRTLLTTPALKEILRHGGAEHIPGDIADLGAASDPSTESDRQHPLRSYAEALVLAQALRDGATGDRQLLRWTQPSSTQTNSLDRLIDLVEQHLGTLERDARTRAASGQIQWRAGQLYEHDAPHGECCERTAVRIAVGVDMDELAQGTPGPVQARAVVGPTAPAR
jgi:hypothetical protein